MFIRYLSATSIGMPVTVALLYLMQLLIDHGPAVIVESTPRRTVDWIQPPVKEELIVEERRHTRPDPPPQLPDRPPGNDGPGVVAVTGALPRPVPPVNELVPFGSPAADRPLVAVVRVRPEYPPAAIGRNLQGYVTVRFDVLASGAVANVEVLESSHAIFHKAAVAAAYRFRFQPRTVDGVPQDTRGVVNRFVFELDD